MKYFKVLSLVIAMIPVGQVVAKPSTADVMPVFKQIQSIVYALHADKPSQLRVRALDGSEYTGGQVLRLKAQLRVAEAAMASGNSLQATNELQQIAVTLKEHGAQIDTGMLLARVSQTR
jgi:hypothetical protein